ncbi:oxygenase MpaB family protein [Dinghuibacter sp.]|jgi:uncharacterized protein (DUF2236 family)|uniref:oxygenase MpaB family protein n=1 Tax=Dinghuibacter sp. TaxID=2024697 RepID=UPI002D80A348|nr:oxygenase MpaB family protein [Dinghuibacter sp.]
MFVAPTSIVRTIWGRADTVLLIFAGAAAEFALNKSVDWLYFTGRLPKDPLGRLFSTLTYAQRIVFASEKDANKAIDSIAGIHKGVEAARGASIPAEAYLDVLFMLIGYSISAFELVDRRLTMREKGEIFDVFYRMGRRMGLEGLPQGYLEYELARETHLDNRLAKSGYANDLYRQYRKHLGAARYALLLQGQALLAPPKVRELLTLPGRPKLHAVIPVYKLLRRLRLETAIARALLPKPYRDRLPGY